MPFYKKKRYLVLFLTFLGFINLYTLRVNLSVAIVAQTQVRNVTLENGTMVEQQYFDWSSEEKGFALGAFFYGYITTQIIGGFASAKFGGHLVKCQLF